MEVEREREMEVEGQKQLSGSLVLLDSSVTYSSSFG